MRAAIVAGLVAVVACGGDKARRPETPPVQARRAMPPDSAAQVAADSAKPGMAPKKGEGPLRDSAVGPKFSVDSNGKVTPIKKP